MKPRPLDPYLEKLWSWIKRNWRAEHPEAGLRRTLLAGANDAAKYWQPQKKK